MISMNPPDGGEKRTHSIMTDRSSLTEIAVAASLATRELAHLDHDEIGILTVRAHAFLARTNDGLIPARDIATQVAVFDKALTARIVDQASAARAEARGELPVERVPRAPLGSESNPITVAEPVWPVSAGEVPAYAPGIATDATTGIAGANAAGLADTLADQTVGERLTMRHAGGSATDETLFAATLENLSMGEIYEHTTDAVDSSVAAWSDMRSASLNPVAGTHKVIGSTISMEAVLEIVEITEGDDVAESVPVLITIDNMDDPLCSPVIDLRRIGLETLAEKTFAARISDVEVLLLREISDLSVDKFSHGWEEVDSVSILPISGSYVQSSERVSMRVLATFKFTDGSQTQGYLTFALPAADASLLTGRVKA